MFRHYHGLRKNIPVVRVGNLATLAEEQVETQRFGLIAAYLLEARSIGGISGSPVFINQGTTRSVGGRLQLSNRPAICLLGLIHGHFDTDSANADANDPESSNSYVNTGIAIVTPFEKIKGLIDAQLGS